MAVTSYLPPPLRYGLTDYHLKLLQPRVWLFWKDKRPAWVQAEEREFIKAVNSLKTLQTTPRGLGPHDYALCGLVRGHGFGRAPGRGWLS